jgi:F0F1-type ATP synthase assembly protein I
MTNDDFQANDTLGRSADEVTSTAGDDTAVGPEYPPDPPPLTFIPDSLAETTRKSGLAWSAGIVFFSSIAFMLVLGWFADLLLGSSPWGLVVGIVLGSVVGFLQFFRITSSIFKQPPTDTPPRTLMTDEPEEHT